MHCYTPQLSQCHNDTSTSQFWGIAQKASLLNIPVVFSKLYNFCHVVQEFVCAACYHFTYQFPDGRYTNRFIDSEIDQPFCIDAHLSLISKDLDAIEVIAFLLLYNVDVSCFKII